MSASFSSPLRDLPDELLSHALSFCGLSATFNAAASCKRFAGLCRVNGFASVWMTKRITIQGDECGVDVANAVVATGDEDGGYTLTTHDARERYRLRWNSARFGSGLLRRQERTTCLEMAVHPNDNRRLPYSINAAAICDTHVATGASDKSIRVYGIQDGRLRVFEGHKTSVKALAFDGANSRVLSVSEPPPKSVSVPEPMSTIKLWDLHTGAEQASVNMRCQVNSMFVPNKIKTTLDFFHGGTTDTLFVSSSEEHGAEHVAWHPAGGGCVVTNRLRRCVLGATSVDEPNIAYGWSEGGLSGIDLRQGPPGQQPPNTWTAPRMRPAPEPGWRPPLHYTPSWLAADSQRIVGLDDRMLSVWDVRKNGPPLCSVAINSYEPNLAHRRHKGLHLAPRGRLLVVTYSNYAGKDGQISLWDLRTLPPNGAAAASTPAANPVTVVVEGGGASGAAGRLPFSLKFNGAENGELGADAMPDEAKVAFKPIFTKMKMPPPYNKNSLLLARIVGQQSVVAMTPKTVLGSWRIGSNMLL